MIVIVDDPRVAGPLAVAIADLRRRYRDPDPDVRQSLADLQAAFTKAAKGGHSAPSFDPTAITAQAARMPPILVTFAEAADLLACSVRTVNRRVRGGDLAVVGEGPAARVVVASIEAFVARGPGTHALEATA